MTGRSVRGSGRLRLLRYSVGVLISAAALWITLDRLNVPEVIDTLRRADLAYIAVALLLVTTEVAVRAWRWRVLLQALGSVRFREALGYLCIGYFANSVLPARLGDVARAYLGGTRLGLRRLGTLGTIVVERVSDGSIMLAVVLVGSLALPTANWLRLGALSIAIIGLVGLTLGLGAAFLVGRSRWRRARATMWLSDLIKRVTIGARGLTNVVGLTRFVAASLLGFALSALVLGASASAVQLRLSPGEAGLVAAGLALSLAIPAAPSSIGTYELAGVALLTSFGYPGETALAAVVLTHALALLPPAAAGAAFAWLYHVKVEEVTTLGEGSETDPARRDVPMTDNEP